MYKRRECDDIIGRLNQPQRLIQVISGPRQVGKTTAIQMVLDAVQGEKVYCSCDDPGMHDRIWLESQWESGRLKAKQSGQCILVIDEIQKIENWSETVKRLWDEDTAADRNVKVVVLGSSSVLIHKGLGESLAGRFEMIRLMHWSFGEMQAAFGWNCDQFILFGGYPGGAALVDDFNRWRDYINDSLIEATVSKDILHMTRIDKPALLRRLFALGCAYSGQIVSYQKLLGQLQDAGNTTTLARYLHILDQAGLLTGIRKFSGGAVRSRDSTPKLHVYNNALMTAQQSLRPEEIRRNTALWGRFIESAIGVHLINQIPGSRINLYYWREKNREIDFLLQNGDLLIAVEVKSSLRDAKLPGMESFGKKHALHKKLLVGSSGIPVEEFLKYRVEELF
jgi:predicted AAA+ superfamily ATPase